MDRDRRSGLDVGLADGAQHALHTRGEPLLLDRALEEGCPDTGVRDALAQVAHEQLHHRLGYVEEQPGTGVVELEGDLVVGVEPRGRDDVDVHLLVDPLDARQVPTQPDHGRVDDRVDTAGPECGEPLDGVGDPGLLVPRVRVVGEVLLVWDHTCHTG